MIDTPEFLIDWLGAETAETVSRLAIVAVIFILTLLMLRWVIGWTITHLLHLTDRTRTTLDERLIGALEPPLRFIIGALAIWWALHILQLSEKLNALPDRVIISLVTVAIFVVLFRVIDVFADPLEGLATLDSRVDASVVRFGQQVLKGILVLVAFVVVMNQFGYNLNGLLAGLGIGGLAVALAAQEALSNLVGYFVILSDSPFYIGDYIESEAATGVVEKIGFRSTRIRKLDQGLVVVPNAKLTANSITNWSRLSKRRLDMNVGITYDSTPNQILAVVQGIRDMLHQHPRIIQDSVFVQFVNFGESTLDIRIICHINEPRWTDFQQIKQDINLKIIYLLQKHKVEFAFPSRTLVIKSADSSATSRLYPIEPELATALPQAPEFDLPQPDAPESTEEIGDA